MNKRLQVIKYIIVDFLAAAIAWCLFFIFRKYSLEPDMLEHINEVLHDPNFYIGIAIVPMFWLIMYSIVGTYNSRKIYRKSRMR